MRCLKDSQTVYDGTHHLDVKRLSTYRPQLEPELAHGLVVWVVESVLEGDWPLDSGPEVSQPDG